MSNNNYESPRSYENESQNDDLIVRSLRSFGLYHLYAPTNNNNSIDQADKVRQEFLSNGSEPIDFEDQETKLYNMTSNYAGLIADCLTENHNNWQSDAEKTAKIIACNNQSVLNHRKLSPFDNKKREKRVRSISYQSIQTTENRCVFCSNNNEPLEVIKSHSVRDTFGRVLCPKLRTYVCPICNCSGDKAHTIKYCPKKPVITMEDSIMLECIKYNKEVQKTFGKFR